MDTLIERLDVRTAQSAGNTEVVKLNYLDAKKIAPMLTKLATSDAATKKGTGAAKAAVSIQAEETDNAIVIRAPRTVLRNLRSVIRKLDVRPGQVLVQAIIVRMDTHLLEELGVNWQTTGSGPSTSATFRVSSNGIGLLPGTTLDAVLNLLSTNDSSDVLATPSVMVLNNQKASLSDGKEVSIKNREYALNPSTSTAGSDNQAGIYNTFSYRKVTLNLDVTPRISPNNTLRLDIAEKNDRLSSESVAAGANPGIDTSTLKTNVLVHSGDVLVLGGLISNNQIENVSKVPILGDIPLLGRLFRSTRKDVRKTSLMVFIRPIIVHNQKETQSQTRHRYNYIRNQQIKVRGGRRYRSERFPLLPKLADAPKLTLPPPMHTR